MNKFNISTLIKTLFCKTNLVAWLAVISYNRRLIAIKSDGSIVIAFFYMLEINLQFSDTTFKDASKVSWNQCTANCYKLKILI